MATGKYDRRKGGLLDDTERKQHGEPKEGGVRIGDAAQSERKRCYHSYRKHSKP